MQVMAARSTSRAKGGVLARGLAHRLGARGEPMPIQHALSIVVSAAARVHAAHIAGTRLVATLETVLIRFDGVVEVEAVPALVAGDRNADLVTLGQLLSALVRGATIPATLAEAVASVIDLEHGPASAGELARTLGLAARAANINLSRGELGRWARRQVHPPRLAHTLRRDEVPELGVDLGTVKARGKGEPARPASLALGSGHFRELSLEEIADDDLAIPFSSQPAQDRAPTRSRKFVRVQDELDEQEELARIAELECEAATTLHQRGAKLSPAVVIPDDDDAADVDLADDDAAVDVALDDLVELAATPALAAVELPLVAPAVIPRAYGTIVLAAFAVLVILAAAGVLLFYPR